MKLNWIRLAAAAWLWSTASMGHAALVFAINEGVTYRVTDEEIRLKYVAIAADLTKLLKQPVMIEPINDYPALRKGLAAQTYDLALVHPAHVSINAIKHSGYKLLAVTRGYQQYTANFLARGDSPLTTLTDLKGHTLGVPDEDSITSWMVRATLRDAMGPGAATTLPVKYTYTRFQDAVPFFIENGLTSAGATASGSIIKSWQAKGGKVLGKSRSIPIKHVIASPHLSAEQQSKVHDYLLMLDSTEDGKKKLETIKYQGFDNFDEAEMLKIGTWLGL